MATPIPNTAAIALLRTLASMRRALGQDYLASALEALADRKAIAPLAWNISSGSAQIGVDIIRH